MIYLRRFIKKNIVFSVAMLFAVASAFVVHPKIQYLEYIDFRVLGLLFCLMCVVNGLESVGVFDNLIQLLLKYVKNTRQLVFILVLVCFFTSMWITNDVALLTFVPFAIMILDKINRNELLIFTIVMQTIAANLGSMLMPIGNPQNLYLFSVTQMQIGEFIQIMLVPALVSLIMIIVTVFFVKNSNIEFSLQEQTSSSKRNQKTKSNKQTKLIIYVLLFVFCLLTVLHIISYIIILIIVIGTFLILDRKIIKRADYILLLTFIAFFIFVGNMKQVAFISQILNQYVKNNELIVSVIVSQFVSNVPAAVLLSGFTDNYRDLLIGTNIGGLGTLIASMASLISYKFYANTKDSNTKKYLKIFTLLNVLYLFILILVVFIISLM